MKNLIFLSLLSLFFIISIPSAFADNITIVTVDESGFSQACVDTGCYVPLVTTVNIGDTVTMTNSDPTGVHTFTSGFDDAFTQGIQFLIKEKIVDVESISQSSTEAKEIPTWVKNNVKWWADGSIDEGSFVTGIEFLIKEGIISVN